MNELPQIPSYYVKTTVEKMYPGDIYYPLAEILQVDRITHQPHINKYESLANEDQRPKRLVGRFGLMRVLEETASGLTDGYIIDIRPIDFSEIEQDDFTPLPEDDYDTIQRIEEDKQNFMSPLGIIASDRAVEHTLYLGDQTLLSHMKYLAEYTDDLKDMSDQRIAQMDTRRRDLIAKRPNNIQGPPTNEAQNTKKHS
jgi:hypothetical protein